MLATPTPVRTILTGETLGRYGVGLFQGLYIMAFTWLLFGVNWGDPLGAMALLKLFALVGAGAAMLLGAVFTNDQQASGIGIVAALALAALRGAIVTSG